MFSCPFYSFRSSIQTSTVGGSTPQTGRTRPTTSQRLNLPSSTSRRPKLSVSGTKLTNRCRHCRSHSLYVTFFCTITALILILTCCCYIGNCSIPVLSHVCANMRVNAGWETFTMIQMCVCVMCWQLSDMKATGQTAVHIIYCVRI